MQSSDLQLLLSLDALLQEGSVTRAAKRAGISTPAMSHALARARARFGDPLLVRSGREMVPTPRADSLRARVHTVVSELEQLFAAEGPFEPEAVTKMFVIRASDYVLAVVGSRFDRLVAETAPRAGLRFLPNTTGDPESLREGSSDLAIGIYGALPPELLTKKLLTDRFVCVVRRGNSTVPSRLDLKTYAALPQIQIAPRGRSGGYVDAMLAERGLERRVARAVPYFLSALYLARESDYVLTVSERLALRFADELGLRVLEAPLELRSYALSMVWHPRHDADPAHAHVRRCLEQAAESQAGDRHADARTRLNRGRGRPGRRKGR